MSEGLIDACLSVCLSVCLLICLSLVTSAASPSVRSRRDAVDETHVERPTRNVGNSLRMGAGPKPCPLLHQVRRGGNVLVVGHPFLGGVMLDLISAPGQLR